jgi:hypothetical protein
MSDEKFDTFAIVQVMGHQAYAGRASEASIGGASFLRIDVPETNGEPGFTKFLGAGSIFDITPCDEETALRAAASLRTRPFEHLTTIHVPQIEHYSDDDWQEDDYRPD